ncbi:EpsG family protein [Erysipelothrix sp. HDW6C]|uniref:EpsG family protein n=1 Tax=Erysipelothrix sp. HDW6C TaxID=2714930 RepID=UPI00140831CA|nr:EpsG family protein [Erysipelothrix sp. HDW6C]QIK70038.1 EpsG family protein [Erysipelothrix sp. HDW6C]
MYYIGFIYLLLLFVIRKKIPGKFKVMLAFVPFVIIILLRFGVGADYFAYQSIYNSMDPKNINASMAIFTDVEILYKLSNIVFRFIGMPYHLFATLLCSVLVYVTLRWLKDISHNFELSVLLYFAMFFLVWGLSALRQGISIVVLLYIFFNGRRDYSLKVKLFATAVMFFVHAGSVIVLFLYLVSLIKWSKKSFLVLLILGILFNFLPIQSLMGYFENIPYLNKILYYIDPVQQSIFSFASVMRIAFFGIVWYNYDSLVADKKNPPVSVNFVLISFIFYFFMMFSSLVASRLSIYGYYMMIFIIPAIVSYQPREVVKRFAYASVLVFSCVSFYKEMTTLIGQTEYRYSMTQLNFETVFEKNYIHFNKGYAMLENVREIESQDTPLRQRVYQAEHVVEAQVNEEDRYLSVYFPNASLYGILNQKGEIVELPTLDVPVDTFGKYTEVIFNPFEFSTRMYRTIGTDQRLEFDQMTQLVKEKAERDLRFGVYWPLSKEFDIQTMKGTQLETLLSLDSVVAAAKISNDYHPNFNYLQIDTSVSRFFMFIDRNNEIKVNKLYMKIEMYNPDKIAVGYTLTEKHYINEFGEIIWIEPIGLE